MAAAPRRSRAISKTRPKTSSFPLIAPEGDCAVRVQFGETIDPTINSRVHGFCRAVEKAAIEGVVEWVPAYAVATVYYRPEVIGGADLIERLAGLASHAEAESQAASLIEIPVLYGGEWGPDLPALADRAGLSESDVIARHSGVDYRCYMVGFMPGFPYLGEVPSEIRAPRLATPRVSVPAGSVAIAEAQTGIYPQDSPGGWNLIGRTPLRLFDPEADPPALVCPGDFVRFLPIDLSEFAAIADSVARREYVPRRMPYRE